MNQLISHKAVCRTAPATPGLLLIQLGFNTTVKSGKDSEIFQAIFYIASWQNINK